MVYRAAFPVCGACRKLAGAKIPKFSVLNRTNKAVNLAIEPWADLVVISPNGQADFDYDEPAEVEIGLMPDGNRSTANHSHCLSGV